ncbi:MAG TPA: S8 family serine peptidase [Micromonosporaceae bacterium]|nr:S8 family serine peptidase [Micromonosporaceae bacterium]
MDVPKRVGGVLLTAGMLVATIAPSANGAGPRPAPLAAFGPGGSPHTVTLVTGDRISVRVDGSDMSIVRIAPAPGRSRVGFAATKLGGHLRVVPSDALPLLHAGRLDPRLFDITTMVGFGYDDRRKELPLIVTGSVPAVRSRAGVRTVPGGSALRAAKADLPGLWKELAGGLTTRSASAGLPKVWLDGLRKPSLDVSVPQVGAPAAWAAGYTGAGVKVAVVDTGIDATHPDLAGRVVAEQDFTGVGNTLDQVGHGTHVAATIASNDSRYRGVAPGAQLLSAKVCADFGCEESAILAGMQWSAEQGAKVINMSLGGPDTPDLDPLEAAVADLTARFGALFVVAAGNAGGEQTIESPGSADAALTVGAVTKTDELADFSSRGPRRGDFAIKPDISAPGVDIVAARGKDAVFGNPGDLHVPLSGTSMATPHVAGAAAILAQEHPTWTPAQLKQALMGSARPAATIDVFAQGAGRVDVARAITQSVLADLPSVSFGRQLWPHNDDVPTTRTISYHNVGGSNVTLDLSLTGNAPAGLFTLSSSTLSVPAGGTASVTLTSDTRVDVPDARYTGYLVATAGTARVSTPFAVDKEVESHDVTLHHVDRTGQPSQNFFTVMFDAATGTFLVPEIDGQAIRVPKGRYVVLSEIYESDVDAGTMLLEPDVVVDHDVQLALDARNGRLVDVRVSLPQAAAAFQIAIVELSTPSQSFGYGLVYGFLGFKLYTGTSDRSRTSAGATSVIATQFTKNGVDPFDSAYLAQVMWREHGRIPVGLTKRLNATDLATVHAEHASEVPATGLVALTPTWPEGYTSPLRLGSLVPMPGSRVEYYNTDDGVKWIRTLDVFDDNLGVTGNSLLNLASRFEPGQQYHERRNLAPYGPGFSHLNSPPEGWIGRRGDTLNLLPNVINDQLNWFGVPQATDSLRMTLDRNGQRVFEGTGFAFVDVPPGNAQYRLGVDLTRPEPATLSTSVSCVWTFRSGTVSGENGVPLPLSAVRFLPRLDNRNTAPAGHLWPVPIEVQRQPGSAAGPVRTLVVEVSYDDGATWRKVPVVRVGQNATAFLIHPSGSGYVSLRAFATDTAGNTVRETIIRAYRIA